MPTYVLTRRAVLVGFDSIAAAGLSGCNTTQTAGVQPQPATGFRISAIEVETASLLAQSGNPTANWAQQALPGQLSQVFSAYMAPGAPGAATLNARIDSIYLGGGGPADPDRIRGLATLSGGAGPARTTSVRTIAVYAPSPTDQALPEQALQGRVQALAQAFAYRLKRKMRV